MQECLSGREVVEAFIVGAACGIVSVIFATLAMEIKDKYWYSSNG